MQAGGRVARQRERQTALLAGQDEDISKGGNKIQDGQKRNHRANINPQLQ